MKSPPPVLKRDSTVAEACKLMHDARSGAVAVVENGELQGIFTYSDLIDRVVLARRHPDDVPLGEVMTRKVETISGSGSYGDALRLMVDRDYTHVPVVDEDHRVIGLISLRDLLEHEIEHLAHELDSVTQYLSVDGSGGD
jgi:CBS domain-containing protein